MGEAPAPSCLYRYRGYSLEDLSEPTRRSRITSEIEAAKRGEVWFSPLSAQNDPFDTNPCYVRSHDWEVGKLLNSFYAQYGSLASFSGMDLRNEAQQRGVSTKAIKSIKKKKYLPNAFHAAEKMISSHSDNMVISCFSREPADLLMWSYYSNSHSSFCFKFECADNLLQEARIIVGKVKYVIDRPIITTLDIIHTLIGNTYEDAEFIDEAAREKFDDAFILTKSNHWEHEQEWRSLQRFRASPGYYSIRPYKLTGVIFGCRAPKELSKFVVEKLGDDVQILCVTPDKKKYELRIA